MLLRRIAVENVRSFLTRAELKLDGPISILIGPNGGGKTNLLDIAVILLRRHLLASMYPVHRPTPELEDRYELQHNDALNAMLLEPHAQGVGKPQKVEVDLEVTPRDIENMRAMKAQAAELAARAEKKYVNLNTKRAANWDVDGFTAGALFTFEWSAGSLQPSAGLGQQFREYLNDFETDSLLRAEFDVRPLSTPMIYLPVTRAANAFQSRIELSGYNDFEQKRQIDAAISRTNSSIVPLAIGRLAQKFRMLLEQDRGNAKAAFKEDANLRQLTEVLAQLGYDWELESINPLRNAYDIRLKKQGTSFLVGAASSGERELLTYLFAIFALNVRDALIVVDEPELHLHPKWQKTLLQLFSRLVETTGNQFLMATHSGTFISAETVQYVSRVFSKDQQSQVLRLATADLPETKHLLQIVNSQNNEGIFFADEVVLVEGLSDRIFFEATLDRLGRGSKYKPTLEVIAVGGKGLFAAYGKLLTACQVPYSIIADLDYVEQIGTPEIKGLFHPDAREIKRDVIDNIKSSDGAALVQAIDTAIAKGDWSDATDVWTYIKSRRIVLKPELPEQDKSALSDFIESLRGRRIYLLSRGALETCLPEGYRGKDLAKLIEFVNRDDFWSELPDEARGELETIGSRLMQGMA